MKDLEHKEQCAVIQWARLNETKWPCLKYLFHPANGGKRNIRTAVRLKAGGVKAGVPDLVLPAVRYQNVERGLVLAAGLFIEMKSAKGRLTDSQNEWRDYLIKAGYQHFVCYNAGEAIDVITDYLAS